MGGLFVKLMMMIFYAFMFIVIEVLEKNSLQP